MWFNKIIAIGLSMFLVGCLPPPPPKKKGKKTPKAARKKPDIPTPTLSLEEATKPPGGHELMSKAQAEGLGYPRFPDTHSGVVVFSAEGDLWEVSVKGGLARRLTVHAGNEFFAKFSPDGKWLAFSGDYDGNQDVFVMPAVGGRPRRLTYHPSMDQVLGWTPDGKSVLFRSRRYHPHSTWTPYTVPLVGGDPRRLPLWRAARLTYEPGGKQVAINRVSRDFRRWKRYAGGRAAQIFIGDLEGNPFKKITTFKGTNAHPMWHGKRIYFLSDRTGTANIWSTTPEGSDLKQHTRHTEFDARFPSLNQGQIVYQHKAGLRILDLSGGKDSAIPIRVVSDALRTRTRFTNPARYLRRFDLSYDGAYLGMEIRGNLHVIPAAKEGRQIRVSLGSASREQGVSFSPDGKELAAISDSAAETEVFIYDATGSRAPRQVTFGGTCFKYPPQWSPNGKKLAYADSENRLFVTPVKWGRPEQVDISPYGRIRYYRWSPDSKYLVYARPGPNYFYSIFLFNLADKKIIRVTDQYFYDWAPSFSPDGKYLVFLSDRTVNPILDQADRETIIDKPTKPYLVLLSKKTKSPFLPPKPGEKEGKDKAKKKPAEGGKKKPVKVEIDAEGIQQRIVEVPVKAGNLKGLLAGEGFLLYMRVPTLGMADWEKFWWGKEFTAPLVRFDIKKKKEEPFFPNVRGYAVSHDRKKIAIRMKKAKFVVFPLGPKAPKGDELKEHAVPVRTIREEVDPRKEWNQIFNEVWRMMRDFYWARDMAKVDWKAMHKKYRQFLPHVATREELTDLIGEMVAELSLGHTYVWGGDQRRARSVPVGLLGADLDPHASGYYQFTKIYSGANWDKKRKSPLTLSHVKVKEGEFLIKIDGRPIKAGENVYKRMQKAAGELILLTVNGKPSETGARDVEVKTLKSEREVRYYTWVKQNREYVDQKTGGKVGYLHIPDMMSKGMIEFDRWFYPQVRKQGLIVDARWNRGGFVSQIMIKRLARKILSWARARRGWTGPYPANTVNGQIVVLTNESAGSDGDIFPRAIQVGKIGPVIGTRTWGGVVGISLRNPLVDRGVSTRPTYFAWWEPKRRWRLEGEGVTPDIVVDNDPGAMHRGKDTQLDKGIEVILDRLRSAPPKSPAFGPSPDKTKKAWVKRYGKVNKP